MEDVVEDLWRHIFWSCHGKLRDMLEFKAGAIIDEFHFREFVVVVTVPDKNVFGFEIRMDNFALT